MAHFSKRTRTARKRAGRRAKAARKAAARTSARARAQAAGGLAVAIAVAVATARLIGQRRRSDQATYKPQPDNLPNEPERPAGTTPMPTTG